MRSVERRATPPRVAGGAQAAPLPGRSEARHPFAAGASIARIDEIPYHAAMKYLLRASFALAVFFFSGALPALAQTTISDPSDPIYLQFDSWATRGVLKNLPQLRPYTGAMIDGLLHEVIGVGDRDDAIVAQQWLDTLAVTGVRGRADARADMAIGASGHPDFIAAGPGISLNTLTPGENKLGMSGHVEALVTRGTTGPVTPFGSNYPRDIGLEADSGIGGGLTAMQDINTAMTFGDSTIGVQAGYMRGSWGPVFDDGVVVGPQAPASGQFDFSWRGKSMSADVGFYVLQQGFTDGVTMTSSTGTLYGLSGDKYLMLHGINWSPTDWMTVGFFESMVWADRIEPLYFLPLSELFTSQSLAGWSDNSFEGISGSLYLPHALRFDAVVYADDFDFSGVLKGHFDTKWKLAVQGALSWAPPSSYLQRLSVDYTAVGPYTYTHWASVDGDIGALAYTNAGQNFGPALDPDSDRITFKAITMAYNGFQWTGLLRMIRHGNASAGVNGYNGATSASGNASGNLGDPGMFSDGTDIFAGGYQTGTTPEFFRFLTQSVLEMSYQAGIALNWSNRFAGLGRFDASLSYLFQYTANGEQAGLGPVAGNNSTTSFLEFTAGFGF